MGLAPERPAPAGLPLAGGVSSDIWRVDLPNGPICVKRALARLRVAAEWQAPVERNRYEALWMRRAAAAAPGAVPALLGWDEAAQALAMRYLPPDSYPLWKAELRDGRADPAFAAAVGAVLARIHEATAGRPEVAAEFPTGRIFYQIRLEPYLLAAGRVHADCADALRRLVDGTLATHRALVHGDVSPKNILAGPSGPVLLDAECAWYGDPAFDLAFCLNHLLLKGLWRPARTADYSACFSRLSRAYLAGVGWEPAPALEARAARLLPGLLLARIDGKSPVEYVTEPADKERTRRVARRLLARPADRLADVAEAWREVVP